MLDAAAQRHERNAAGIRAEIEALEKRLRAQDERWQNEKARLEVTLRRARESLSRSAHGCSPAEFAQGGARRASHAALRYLVSKSRDTCGSALSAGLGAAAKFAVVSVRCYMSRSGKGLRLQGKIVGRLPQSLAGARNPWDGCGHRTTHGQGDGGQKVGRKTGATAPGTASSFFRPSTRRSFGQSRSRLVWIRPLRKS
jgi:hypothetical protein